MDLRTILPADIHVYKEMADEYKKEDFSFGKKSTSALLQFLRGGITTYRPETKNPSAKGVEERVGLSLDVSPAQIVERLRKLQALTGVDYLAAAGVQESGLDLERYLDMAETIINSLGFKPYRFTSEKVLTCMNDTEDQLKTFKKDWHNIFVGNLGERALHNLLIEKGKGFTARGYLIHNWKGKQPILDVEAKNANVDEQELRHMPLTIGVRSMVIFSGKYLYAKQRIKYDHDAIGDYVVFFNNFEHHILYVTGIVEKKFLTEAEKRDSNNDWLEFQFPEHFDVLKTFNDLEIQPDCPLLQKPIFDCYGDAARQKLFDRLRKRISFDDFLSRLKDK